MSMINGVPTYERIIFQGEGFAFVYFSVSIPVRAHVQYTQSINDFKMYATLVWDVITRTSSNRSPDASSAKMTIHFCVVRNMDIR